MDDDKYSLFTRLQDSARSVVPTDRTERNFSTVNFFGSRFICCNTETIANLLVKVVAHPNPTPLLLTHINVHNLRSISAVPELSEAIQSHFRFLLEGVGLKAACLLTKGRIPADTNGTDLFPAVLDRLCGIPCRLFLLGSQTNVVAIATQKIEERWPHAKIVGYRDGYFSNDEIAAIRDEVCRAGATILLIALGSPRQEKLALEFMQAPNLQVVWTVGGLFDYLSGRILRAPPLIRVLRLEWLFRIFVEPRRLAIRYLLNALWLTKACVYEWLDLN